MFVEAVCRPGCLVYTPEFKDLDGEVNTIGNTVYFAGKFLKQTDKNGGMVTAGCAAGVVGEESVRALIPFSL